MRQNIQQFTHNPVVKDQEQKINPFHQIIQQNFQNPTVNTYSNLQSANLKNNRAMYSSTIQMTNPTKYVGKLQMMGRFIQVTSDKPQPRIERNEPKTIVPKHQKNIMFSSSIFAQDSHDQMNRFPAFNVHQKEFNLNINKNLKDTNTNSININSKQSVEIKRKQQIQAIKKQLEQMTKKIQSTKIRKEAQLRVENTFNKTSQLTTANRQKTPFNYTQGQRGPIINSNSYIAHENNFNSNYNSQKDLFMKYSKNENNGSITTEKPEINCLANDWGRKSGKLQKQIKIGFEQKEKFHTEKEKYLETNKNISSSHYYDSFTVAQQVEIKQSRTDKLTSSTSTTSSKISEANKPVPDVNQKTFMKKKNPYILEHIPKDHLPTLLPNQILNQPVANIKPNLQLKNGQKKQNRDFRKSDFQMGKKMGKGQFGEVMLVRHKATGFICGMKVMQKKQIREQKYQNQISRELSIQFYLSHRNVASLYGYFSDEQNVYLLIQFCSEGQLLQKLRKDRRMSEEDTSPIIRQICEGVDYIHKELIIHRDIKPQNILFSYGVVKICDFGWAVYRGQGLRKTASGSPLYYSPEIVLGNQYDEKIDIWDIGMMTYECLLGKIPFRIYTEMDLNRIVTDQVKFPEYVDVTEEAKDFILKSLCKNPEQRMEIRQMLRHPFISKYKQQRLGVSVMQDIYKVIN